MGGIGFGDRFYQDSKRAVNLQTMHNFLFLLELPMNTAARRFVKVRLEPVFFDSDLIYGTNLKKYIPNHGYNRITETGDGRRRPANRRVHPGRGRLNKHNFMIQLNKNLFSNSPAAGGKTVAPMCQNDW
jgi:hypothetical protein